MAIRPIIAWGILCLINTYNLYTFYYDALLAGKGLIRKSKQIIVLAQIVFLCFAFVLLLRGYGIVAIVSSQFIYVIITRILSHKVFFNKELRTNLNSVKQHKKTEVLKAVYPNALKLGFVNAFPLLYSDCYLIYPVNGEQASPPINPGLKRIPCNDNRKKWE